ncbi:hypothetical protein F4805DRAFT_96740 [Annulohypoxylon moriforme]|nr:hypothetical protein F4805DRAFT_96740 [Annulohypoxylon moriforme]
MSRLPRLGSVMKNLTTPITPKINWVNKRSKFSTTPIYRESTTPSSFAAKGSIPAWKELEKQTVEQTEDGLTFEQWHKGTYSRYIDSKLGEGGPDEHVKRLQRMRNRLLRIREVLDAEIEACKSAGDAEHEDLVQHYMNYAKWSIEVLSKRLAEVEEYVHELKEH